MPFAMTLQYLSALAYNTTEPQAAGEELLAFLGGCPPTNKPPGCFAADSLQFDYAYYESPTLREFGFEASTWVLLVYDRAADVVIVAFKGTDASLSGDRTGAVDVDYIGDLLFDGRVITNAPRVEVMEGFAYGFKEVFLRGTVQSGLCTASNGARSYAACPQTPMCFITQQMGALHHATGNTRILLTGHSLGGAMAEIAALYLQIYLGAFYNGARPNAVSGLVTFGAPRTGYVSTTRDTSLSWPHYVNALVPFALRITKFKDIVPNSPALCTRCWHAPREVFYGETQVGVCQGWCDPSDGSSCDEDLKCSYGVNKQKCGSNILIAAAYCGKTAHNTIFQNHYIEPGKDSSELCSDSCPDAIDGICDDGGYGAQYSVCEPHTDCTDCGYRLPLPPPHQHPEEG